MVRHEELTTIREIDEGRSAPEALTWSRSMIDPALRGAVAALPVSTRHIVGYHMGWWDEHGRPTIGSEGKAIRPTLVLLTAEAVGGVSAAAVPAAVGVELAHNFSLLHDDVIDGDVTRRHRRTAWTVFGRGPAILAGDVLLSLALEVLGASGHPAAQQGMRMLNAAVLALLHGQSEDLAFEGRQDVDLAECVAMASQKTGALLGCACALGALFGGGSPDQVEHLRRFGESFGLVFQVVDDLLGIWGDPAVTGKPVHSDLLNRKKSLPVVAALTSRTPAGEELAGLYHRHEPLSGNDMAHAAELIEAAGGRAWSTTQIDDLVAEALSQLRLAGATAKATIELRALTRMIAQRDR